MENRRNRENNSVPPDDQHRCTRKDGKGWRCKRARSYYYDPSYYCNEHYNSTWYENLPNYKKQQRRELGGAVLDSYDEIQLKKQRIETTEKTDQLEKCCSEEEEEEEEERSLGEETQKSEVELEEILGVCKTKCVELLAELEKKTKECVEIQVKLAELESMKIAAEGQLEEFKRRQEERRRNLERMVWGKKESRTRGRVTQLEGELEKMGKDMENEKNKAQGDVEFWRNKFSGLEARISRMENDAPPHNCEMERGEKEFTRRDAEFSGGSRCSRVSELQTSAKVVDADEIDMNNHPQVEEEVAECSAAMANSSKSPNLSCSGQKAEDVNGRVVRASESSSEKRLRLSEKSHGEAGNTAATNLVEVVCLVSDDESAGEASRGSSDCSSDSESLGDFMDRLAMKYRNQETDKWEFEADMLSSFEDDPQLCMRAVCALYRLQTMDEKSANGIFHNFDALRIKNLAEFLMDGDPKGDLKKSVKEVELLFTSKALEDCKKLANTYSKQLFGIYKGKQDPFFLPISTASH